MEGPLEIELKPNRMGKEQLYINGYRYGANRRFGKTVYWRCVYAFCHVTAILIDGKVKSLKGEHCCPQKKSNSSPQSLQSQFKAPKKPSPTKLFSIFYKASMKAKQNALQNQSSPQPGVECKQSEAIESNRQSLHVSHTGEESLGSSLNGEMTLPFKENIQVIGKLLKNNLHQFTCKMPILFRTLLATKNFSYRYWIPKKFNASSTRWRFAKLGPIIELVSWVNCIFVV